MLFSLFLLLYKFFRALKKKRDFFFLSFFLKPIYYATLGLPD